MQRKHIAIIGAGFSGVMLTHHLLQHAAYPLEISLFEQSGRFGEGVAYSTRSPHHLLNVRAEKMSAYPAEPAHFANWLQERQSYWRTLDPTFENLALGPQDFAPRMVFGAYLKDQLLAARQLAEKNGHLLHLLPEKVRHIQMVDYHCKVMLENKTMEVDAAVLAVGSLPPKAFPYEKKLFHAPERFARNVWNPPLHNVLQQAQSHLKPTDSVAIIGTGLTMVDTVLTLRDKGFKGRILTFSRHGHLPQIHVSYTHFASLWEIEKMPATALGLLMLVRKTVDEAAKQAIHWQAVIDSLRPYINPLWQKLPSQEKRKFLRHLASLWSIHRHRMPPESAAMLKEMQQSGQLCSIKGSIIDADNDGDALVISYREKYHPGIQTCRVAQLLNCTGAEVDIGKLPSDELLHHLREANYVTAGPLRAGVQQEEGHVKGKAFEYLFLLGPLRFGGLFETIAVPELRVQAEELAFHLLEFLKERATNYFVI